VPLPAAVGTLFRFLRRTTGAADGVLLVRSYDADRQPAEVCRVYDAGGGVLAESAPVPFARSVAGSVVSLGQPAAIDDLAKAGGVELQPFERGRRSLLAARLTVGSGVHVVLELFDKQGGDGFAFTDADRKLVAAAADFGAEILRQALAEKQTQRVLFDAVAAALSASDSVAESLRGDAEQRREQPTPPAVLDRLREGLRLQGERVVPADESVRLAEAVRLLALRHGPAAVQHCIRLVESLREMLDAITAEARP